MFTTAKLLCPHTRGFEGTGHLVMGCPVPEEWASLPSVCLEHYVKFLARTPFATLKEEICLFRKFLLCILGRLIVQ